MYIVAIFIFPTYSFSAENEPISALPKTSTSVYVAPTTFIYEAANCDVAFVQPNIYIASGTTVVVATSEQLINNEELPENVAKKKTSSEVRNTLGISKEFIPQKKTVDRVMKVFQDQLNFNVKNTIYSATRKRGFRIWSSYFREIKSNSSNCKNLVYNKTLHNVVLIKKISCKTFQQVNYTSILLIKLLKADNLSLTSPPLFCLI